MRLTSLACAVFAVGLAGCDEQPQAARSSHGRANSPALLARSVAIAEQQLRAELRGAAALSFRDVQAYPQASPGHVAVCGQVSGQVSGQARAQVFVPFVSFLTWAADTEAPSQIVQLLPMSDAEATRVHVERLAHCADGSGAAAAQRRAAPPPLPRIPTDLPTGLSAGLRRGGDETPEPPGGPLAAADKAQPATPEQAVMLTHAGNLRAHPNGGGEVMQVLPRGKSLRVFATAPGGWLQVGGTEPRGWLHSSLVSAATP